MKKFLAIAAIAATFTACNDEKKAEATEAPKADSPKVEQAMDTAKAAMDTAKAAMDTAKAAAATTEAPKAEEKK